MRVCLLALLLRSASAFAAEQVSICYNYGCIAQAQVSYSDAQLSAVRAMLASARDAQEERAALSRVVGRLYVWAGQQSPVWRDRGGDYADDNADGRMDCIDHSISTTGLLRMIEARGWLRYHRVLERVRRTGFLRVTQHFSAAVEENAASGSASEAMTGSAQHAVGALAYVHCAECAAAMPLETRTAAREVQTSRRFVVDSWFFDNGMPAVVLPLEDWLSGGGPDV